MTRCNDLSRAYAACLLAVVVAICGQAIAGTLYVIGQAANGTTDAATKYGTIDTVLGTYTEISANVSGGNLVQNLAYNGTSFYVAYGAAASTQNLRTLSLTGTAVSASLGDFTNSKNMYGMSYIGSTIYGYDRFNDDYGTISTTGSWTLLTNATGVSTPNVIGGRMAALGGVNYMVDATAGSPRIGSFNGTTAGSTWSVIGGTNALFTTMVLASDGTKLYGLVPITSSSATLYSINTTTGALTLETGVSASANMPVQFSGAAFAVVPEPSTIAIAFSGIVVIGIGARARRRAKASASTVAA